MCQAANPVSSEEAAPDSSTIGIFSNRNASGGLRRSSLILRMSSRAVTTFHDNLGSVLTVPLANCIADTKPHLVNTLVIGLGFLSPLFSLFYFVVLLPRSQAGKLGSP